MDPCLSQISKSTNKDINTVKQIIDEYIKYILIQIAYSGSATTPIGTLIISNNELIVAKTGSMVSQILNLNLTEDDLNQFILDTIDSDDFRRSD